MKLHPLCKLFPPITGQEFDDLVADIKENGLNQPIITFEEMILDGQNRFNACTAAGVTPTFIPFTGKDPKAFVKSVNLNRRHLTTSQRAMLAAQFANCRNSDTSISSEAKDFNVSRDSAHNAAVVLKKSKKLAKKVLAGKLTVHAAQAILNPPKEVPPGADVPVQHLTKPQFDQIFTAPNPKLADAVGDVVYHDPVATALSQRLARFNTWMERQENPYASAPPFTKAAVRTFVTKLLS